MSPSIDLHDHAWHDLWQPKYAWKLIDTSNPAVFWESVPLYWKWQPTAVFLPGKSHGQRTLIGYSPWGQKESDTTERLHLHFHHSTENFCQCTVWVTQLVFPRVSLRWVHLVVEEGILQHQSVFIIFHPEDWLAILIKTSFPELLPQEFISSLSDSLWPWEGPAVYLLSRDCWTCCVSRGSAGRNSGRAFPKLQQTL